MSNHHEIERARSALWAIPADTDRETWVRVGMAAHAGGLSFDDFDGWSAGADSYDPAAARDTWRSFSNKPGGVNAGTLFHLAREHGWADDGQAAPAQPPRAAKPPAPPRKPAPGMAPAEVWSRCQPATAQHAYIVGKGAQGVPLDGLRVVPDGDRLTVAGKRMAGALVVPGFAGDGSLQSLQLIPPPGAGKKLNLTGAPMAGASFTVGELVPGGVAHIVEGIGQAWACWQATGHPAVVCFGAGNMARVAAGLRQRDAAARLVLCPDRGKEAAAEKIAATVGAAVACMPQGEAQNFDANDLAQRDGMEALANILANAVQPPAPEPRIHPLANFLDFDLTPKAPSWVLDGAIEEGVVVMAGGRGIGKTTTIAPLSLVAAGLHAPGDPLAPKPGAWRHVIYLTEHAAQVFRVLAGLVRFGGLGIGEADVSERFHVVNTVRMQPDDVVGVAGEYMTRFARVHRGVTLKPLVVFDTWAASFELESENDNSETSRAVACLKQRFQGMPVWLVAHMAKTAQGRSDVINLSARGAGALEADTIQNVYLVREGDRDDSPRFLSLKGKKRFEPKHGDEFEIVSNSAAVEALDAWGDTERTVLRWNTLKPAATDRQALKAEARASEAKEAQTQLRTAILSRLEVARMTGEPLSKSALRNVIKGQRSESVLGEVELLLSEGWIFEVDVPAKQRANVNRKSFLVGLKDDERRMLLAGQTLPPDVTAIPPAWKKPEIPFVPDESEKQGKSI